MVFQLILVTLSGKTDTRIVRSCGFISKNKRKYGEEEEEEDEVSSVKKSKNGIDSLYGIFYN